LRVKVAKGFISPPPRRSPPMPASSITSIPRSCGLLQLSIPRPGPATSRSVLALTLPAAHAPSSFRLRLGLVAAHGFQLAGEHHRLARDGAVEHCSTS
jgi:hypothetical protein